MNQHGHSLGFIPRPWDSGYDPGILVGSRDVKFEHTGTAPGTRRVFAGPDVRLLGSCWDQHERSKAKWNWVLVLPVSMLGPDMSAGLNAGPIQKMCGARSVLGPDFGGRF